MKILRLKFKNINSFYGEHEAIDFTNIPLSETGLFIIAGSTGAGKSTLLDVITLALFNKVPRLRDVSKTEIENLGSIINQKANEEPKTDAFAEVEYEIKGKQYRSKWTIQKNRNNKWNNYNMEIAELPEGNLLDIKQLKDFPRKNEEIIGLTYSQFVQSIILAQGSFAEFLKANKNERGKLLEDITGTKIYRELGMAAFQKNKTFDEEIKQKSEVLKNFNFLSDEETLQKKEYLERLENQLLTLNKDLAFYTQEKQNRQAFEKTIREIESVQKQQVQLVEQQTNFAASSLQLQRHEQVSEYAAEMGALQEKKQNLSKQQVEQTQVAAQIEMLKGREAETLQSIGSLIGQDVEKAKAAEALVAFYAKIEVFDKDIAAIDSEVKPVFENIKQEIKLVNDADVQSLSLTNIEENISYFQNRMAMLEKNIAKEEVDLSALEKVEKQKSGLSQLRNEILKRDDLLKQGTSKNLEKAENETWIEKNKPAFEALQRQIVAYKENLQQLTEQKNKHKTEVDLEELRGKLVADEPCPLCGSKQHPYIQHYVNVLGELELKITQIEKTKDLAEQQFQSLDKEIDGKNKINAHLAEQLKALREQYKQANEICKNMAESLYLNENSSTEEIDLQIQVLDNQRKNIEKSLKEKVLLEQVGRLLTNYQKLLVYKENKEKLRAERSQFYRGNDIKADCDKLSKTFAELNSALGNGAEKLEKLSKDILLLQQEIVQIQTNLEQALREKQIEGIEQAQSYLLSKTLFENLKIQRENLKNKALALATELLTHTKNRNEIGEKLQTEMLLNDVEEQVIQLSNNQQVVSKAIGQVQQELKKNEEEQSRFAQHKQILETLQQKQRKWKMLNEYIGDAVGNKFSTFAQNLTLSNLIGLANMRLKELSDRYLLCKPKGDEDSLFVYDGYQGNAERSVLTLSGGETFTISLALALALSDLASRNVRLDSLFIDEGFGTLDPDTLETAISTLEKIQHDNQKMIGVISHRQEMKDRINVQVQVEKGVDGNSKVAVITQ